MIHVEEVSWINCKKKKKRLRGAGVSCVIIHRDNGCQIKKNKL